MEERGVTLLMDILPLMDSTVSFFATVQRHCELSPVELHFIENFEKEQKQLKNIQKF